MAYNDPGEPGKIAIQEADVTGIFDKVKVVPCSVTLFRLSVQ
jgi:hypothetical protein